MEVVNINEIIKNYENYYLAEVYKQRQLPSFNDGMRVVQRRLYWAFFQRPKENLTKFTKSASIVGDVIKYHPHGDQSIYKTLIKEINFNQNILIQGKGNWGSNGFIKYDAAAMRYTECRITEKGLLFFKYINMSPKEIGETGLEEPKYLIIPFPYALVQGFYGIIKDNICRIPIYKMKDLYEYLLYILGYKNEKIVIKPNIPLKMKGDFEKILETGEGTINYFPEILLNKKDQRIILLNCYPELNVYEILDKITKKLDFSITIKDLSSIQNRIIIEPLRKISDTDFNKLLKLIKTKLTCKVHYKILVFNEKSETYYTQISIKNWLLENFKRLKEIRTQELNENIEKLQKLLKKYQIIQEIKPIIKNYLLNTDIKTLITKIKETKPNLSEIDITDILNLSLNNIIIVEDKIKETKKKINQLKEELKDENVEKYILNWIKSVVEQDQ